MGHKPLRSRKSHFSMSHKAKRLVKLIKYEEQCWWVDDAGLFYTHHLLQTEESFKRLPTEMLWWTFLDLRNQ